MCCLSLAAANGGGSRFARTVLRCGASPAAAPVHTRASYKRAGEVYRPRQIHNQQQAGIPVHPRRCRAGDHVQVCEPTGSQARWGFGPVIGTGAPPAHQQRSERNETMRTCGPHLLR